MKNIKRIIALAVFIVITTFIFSQIPSPSNNGNVGSGDASVTPLIDGVIMLITGGLLYGIYKFIPLNKK